MWPKFLGRFASCYWLEVSRNRNLESDSSSISYRRMSAIRSLSRGRSLNGVSPSPLFPDGGGLDSMEQLKADVETLGHLVDLMNKPNDKSTTASRFDGVKSFVQSNIPQLAQLFEKIGGAATGQIPGIADKTSGSEVYREISYFLKDLGQLHWVGAGLVVVALTLDHCSKASKHSEELIECMRNLTELGKHVLRLHGHVQQKSESLETLHKSVRLISECAAFCSKAVKKRDFVTRCIFATTDHEKLVDLRNQINELYPRLNLTAIHHVLENMHPQPTGETFELTEDTVMVGTPKRLDEAFKVLNDSDDRKCVRSLTLCGMLGAGKSTVGWLLAAELKKKKNFDNLRCCAIAMRTDEDKIIVKQKQEEVYRKLHRGGIKDFSDPAEGRRELQSLFSLLAEPALLLFDNVQSGSDLESLLPDKLNTCLHPESILLVTTENRGVCDVLVKKGVFCLSYEVKELEEKEAKDLLLKKIFGGRDVSRDTPLVRTLMENADFQKLLDICKGVPLAVSVVGSLVSSCGRNYLATLKGSENQSFEIAYGKLDPHRQREFLDKLKRFVNHTCKCLLEGDPIHLEENRLQQSLEFAYKRLKLNPRIRDVFLDIVAVHLGRSWNDAELLYADDLATLKQLSMVKRLVYKDGHAIVQVHDLLIGVSRKMENNESPDRRVEIPGRRPVGQFIDVNKPPKCFRNNQASEVCDRLEVLKVDHSKEVLSAVQLDRVTSNLKYLELNGTKVTGSCVTVPHKLQYFSSRKSSLPFQLDELLNLVVLDVDLGMCATSNLESIQAMPNLQKLKIQNSTNLKRLGPKCERLSTVIIEHCPNFESIEGLNPVALQHLEIVTCPKFDFSSVSKLKCLEKLSFAGFELNLAGSEFTEFPETLVIPCGVQIVDLSRNRYLRVLPKFASRNRIKKLNLRFCRSLQDFTGEMIHSTSLEYLDVGGCVSLKRLSSLPDHFQKLQVLDVQGCTKVDRSELRQSVQEIKVRNPEFRLIGLRLKDEDDVPGRCAALNECLKIPCWKALKLVGKVSQKSLGACSTFPPRNKDELPLKDEDDVPEWCAAVKQCLKIPYRKTRTLIERVPQRSLTVCCTFPLGNKHKYL